MRSREAADLFLQTSLYCFHAEKRSYPLGQSEQPSAPPPPDTGIFPFQVIRLKRHQKLRRVVVSAIRRQNFAGHVMDISSATRKWKQLVRRCRENERLSLEIAAFSPMTPMRAGATSSARRSGGSGGGGLAAAAAVGVRGYGTGVEEGKGEVTPSFYRSPFPATSAADRSSSTTRRRLWDQSSPKESPIENISDS